MIALLHEFILGGACFHGGGNESKTHKKNFALLRSSLANFFAMDVIDKINSEHGKKANFGMRRKYDSGTGAIKSKGKA